MRSPIKQCINNQKKKMIITAPVLDVLSISGFVVEDLRKY